MSNRLLATLSIEGTLTLHKEEEEEEKEEEEPQQQQQQQQQQHNNIKKTNIVTGSKWGSRTTHLPPNMPSGQAPTEHLHDPGGCSWPQKRVTTTVAAAATSFGRKLPAVVLKYLQSSIP